jgi:hypothetical protein
MLTEAEAHWKPVIAAHAPGEMFSAPALMASSDGGYTYVLPGSEVDPIALRVYSSSSLRNLLYPGPEWDLNADYTHDTGGAIRMTGGRQRSFSDGPYARYVAGPAAISAGVDSTIYPKRARLLLVHYACMTDASRGGVDDPAFYRSLMQNAAFGDPLIPGDIGIVGSLKLRNIHAGIAASSAGGWKARWMYPNG